MRIVPRAAQAEGGPRAIPSRLRATLARPISVAPRRRDAVTLSACRGKLWQTKPSALGPLKVGGRRSTRRVHCRSSALQTGRRGAGSTTADQAARAAGARPLTTRPAVTAVATAPSRPAQDLSVPQSWFLHFYLVGAVCNAAALLAFACTCCGGPAAPAMERVRACRAGG
jgi:hypothetical protein